MEPLKPHLQTAQTGLQENSCDLFILAAESSADVHGEEILKELFIQNSKLNVSAIAGPRMREYSIKTFMPMEEFQVMGFSDILFSLPGLVKKFYTVKREILRLNPKIVFLIDYPGFNLKMAKHLKKSGYKGLIIQYVCPTVWAWRKGRVNTMAKYLDMLIPLFPFEKKCFEHTSLPVEYLGNPLVGKTIKNSDECQRTFLTLFPGSREKEIKRNLPLQLYLGRQLSKQYNLDLAVVSASDEIRPLIENICSEEHIISNDKLYDQMDRTKLALATSGTITLELALRSVPTIVNYAIKPFDEFLATKVFRINLPFYCIVNILLNKEVFPEFYGSRMVASEMLKKAKKFLESSEYITAFSSSTSDIKEILTTQNAAKNIATKLNLLASE